MAASTSLMWELDLKRPVTCVLGWAETVWHLYTLLHQSFAVGCPRRARPSVRRRELKPSPRELSLATNSVSPGGDNTLS